MLDLTGLTCCAKRENVNAEIVLLTTQNNLRISQYLQQMLQQVHWSKRHIDKYIDLKGYTFEVIYYNEYYVPVLI